MVPEDRGVDGLGFGVDGLGLEERGIEGEGAGIEGRGVLMLGFGVEGVLPPLLGVGFDLIPGSEVPESRTVPPMLGFSMASLVPP